MGRPGITSRRHTDDRFPRRCRQTAAQDHRIGARSVACSPPRCCRSQQAPAPMISSRFTPLIGRAFPRARFRLGYTGRHPLPIVPHAAVGALIEAFEEVLDLRQRLLLSHGLAGGRALPSLRLRAIFGMMQRLDLTDNERVVLITALRRLVDFDPRSLSPQTHALKAILERLEPHEPQPIPDTAGTG